MVKRGFWLLALLLGVLVAGCGRRERPPEVVVLVALDAWRGGAGAALPPALAQVAATGVWFPGVFAPASWTAPSLASVLTGASPRSHGVHHGLIGSDGSVQGQQPLAADVRTLAERFAAAGYDTALLSASPYVSTASGLARGFATFQQLTNAAAPQVSAAALAYLQAARRPLFLVVHYSDLQLPRRWPADMTPAPRLDGAALAAVNGAALAPLQARFDELIAARRDTNQTTRIDGEIRPLREALAAIYEANVKALDTALAPLLAAVPTERSLLAVFGLCGEGLLEHGLIGNGSALYPEMSNVTLLLRGGRNYRGGLKIQGPLTLLDLPLSVGEALGWHDLPADGGVALAAVVQKRQVPRQRLIFIESEQPRSGSWRGVVAWPWKLTLHLQGGRVATWLSHLSFDPGETSNLAMRQPEIAKELGNAARQWWGM